MGGVAEKQVSQLSSVTLGRLIIHLKSNKSARSGIGKASVSMMPGL